jgi:mannose-6-phosphate isomerase-like protein (cupin superfamily)
MILRTVGLGIALVLCAFGADEKSALGTNGLGTKHVPDPRVNQGTVLSRAEVDAVLKALPPGSGTEQMLRMVDVGKLNVGLTIMRREPKKQGAIEHDDLTEVYIILSGSGTLVTGRNEEDPQPFAADSNLVKNLTGPSKRGPSIIGGHAEKFGPGDAIIIPAGVAHWFSQLDSQVNYLVVRIDPDKLLPRK